MQVNPEDYTYTITWSEVDLVYLGRVAEFPSLVAHGSSPVAALQEILAVVGYVLEEQNFPQILPASS